MTVIRPFREWRRFAACRGLPTALFYPRPDAPAGEALAVCSRCPVRAVCEQHAVAEGEEFGIWGGRTETERARIARSANPTRGPRRRGPAAAVTDDDLIDLVWHLDPKQPAADQIRRRLGVSIPTAYKYLHRAMRLGVIEQRGRHLYPAS
jgi:WhiB family redox-sensing transcriptional regulator